ncbi:MAG: Eco57I restriction-modification methylase domain-containing protein [Ramlibacter sp.]
MTAPRPLEADCLAPAEAAVRAASRKLGAESEESRLQVLEACASRFGGFDLAKFHSAFGVKPLAEARALLELAAPICAAIQSSPIPPALALSALAREALGAIDRKNTGAYHTDFRLARRIAELAAPGLDAKSKVIDPACGAGILLAALTIAVCGADRKKTAEWLANSVCAADLSRGSLRSALLSLASLTDDVPALVAMRSRWHCGDSLLADSSVWKAMAPTGFDAVVGNPPWEKVKLTKHEFLLSNGHARDYGQQTGKIDARKFERERDAVADYSRALLTRYPELAATEPDLYIAFSSLFFELCKPGGVVAALVPGGLIRSQGTESVRRKLFEASSSASISIIENRARFFEIDTRFKFLALGLVKAKSAKAKKEPIKLLHERGTPTGTEVFGTASIGRAHLAEFRPDLSIPEVRSQNEWKIFTRVCEGGVAWDRDDGPWKPRFCREVDMTKERPKFLSKPTKTALPLIEGRIVHHHRFGVKGHESGTGRSAVWRAFPMGASVLSPQFWIEPKDMPRSNQVRPNLWRVGFCDIAGQTNERSLMAAVIPPGVACGNKVPTIVFGDGSQDRLLVWTAVANSFPFDWMLRRVITTTINYFLLQSIPMPKLVDGGLPWQKLLSCATELRRLDTAGASSANMDRMAALRAEIDAEVSVAYGLSLDELALMLHDFPILDRGQPPLVGETKSTITRDTALAAAAKRMGDAATTWQLRAAEARSLGARPYVPSEIAGEGVGDDEDGGRKHG